MRQVKIEAKRVGDWGKKFLELSDVSTVIDESCEILGPDGRRAALLLRGAVKQETILRAWFHLRDYWPLTKNRGASTGGIRKNYLKNDGTVSKTTIAEDANSGVIGYMDRYPRMPFCRKCAWNQHHPEAFADLLPLIQEVNEAFREHWFEKWMINDNARKKTHPDFVIPQTAFTTVTVNKNYRTACHQDPKNLDGSISSMLVIHDGRISGGELVLPEFDLALRFRHGDLVWFENKEVWHGNAPIVQLQKSAQRCTMVFYFRDGMVHCGSHEQELERARSGIRTAKDAQ